MEKSGRKKEKVGGENTEKGEINGEGKVEERERWSEKRDGGGRCKEGGKEKGKRKMEDREGVRNE